MRPGCDRPAAARVAFDPVALQLWLDPLSRNAAPVQELCEFHVERLTIPRGWSATDRRAGVPLAEVPVPTVSVDLPAGPAPEPDEPKPEPVPNPDPDPEPAEPELAEPEPEWVEPDLVEPEPDEHEPEPALAPAASDPPSGRPADRKPTRRPPGRPPSRRPAKGAEPSLLSRAFAWTGPQESILTQGGADDLPAGADQTAD